MRALILALALALAPSSLTGCLLEDQAQPGVPFRKQTPHNQVLGHANFACTQKQRTSCDCACLSTQGLMHPDVVARYLADTTTPSDLALVEASARTCRARCKS